MFKELTVDRVAEAFMWGVGGRVNYATDEVDRGPIRMPFINHDEGFGIYSKTSKNGENGFESAHV